MNVVSSKPGMYETVFENVKEVNVLEEDIIFYEISLVDV